MRLDDLLRTMTGRGASDLHLKPMRPPLIRVDGRLRELDGHDDLTPETIRTMVFEILTPSQKECLDDKLAVDIGYGIHGLARFRGNIYVQRGTLAAAFRVIPYDIQSVDDLELPPVLLEFAKLPMGLVLVTGPTGSGKSTTLAALIRHISETRPAHIITIEDPIEFLFTDDRATISQREVGTDTVSFAEALRNVMRQDPDAIMVGEMRDPETVGTVITAAETGHLVFSTLHTNNAPQTIDRILDTFPPNQQAQVRAQLAQVLKGVVSMKLVERRDGGRIAALEVMRGSPKILEMIEKGHTDDMLGEIESSVGYYRMQSMNQSLMALLVHGTISYPEAMMQSSDPEDLSLKLRKMFPNIEKRGDEMPSTADFSEIVELQEYKKLYQEQEERQKVELAEKEEEIAALRRRVEERESRIDELEGKVAEEQEEQERMRADYKRLKDEAQRKIEKLMGRIKELNERLLGEESEKKSGIFGS